MTTQLLLNIPEARKARDKGIEPEVWININGYDYQYQVSNTAKVRVLSRPTCFNSQLRKDRKKVIPGRDLNQRYRVGYKSVSLRKGGKSYAKQVHRLVAEAFIPNPNKLPFINHKNGIRDDNRIENLEWCTPKENAKHAFDIGLAKSGQDASYSKLTEDNIREIFRLRISGISGWKIARKFGVYKNCIYHILNGVNWRRFTEKEGLLEQYQNYILQRKKVA